MTTTYKRIIESSAPLAEIAAALPASVDVRRTRSEDAIVIEGPVSDRKAIDKAAAHFDPNA